MTLLEKSGLVVIIMVSSNLDDQLARFLFGAGWVMFGLLPPFMKMWTASQDEKKAKP